MGKNRKKWEKIENYGKKLKTIGKDEKKQEILKKMGRIKNNGKKWYKMLKKKNKLE